MTKQLSVLLAIKSLVAAALPLAGVSGFDSDASVPQRIGAGGHVIGHPGDPGQPEVDLSPVTYNFSHQIFLEVIAPDGAGGAALDVMLESLGVAIAADQFLGGLCEHFAAESFALGDRETAALPSTNWATVTLLAEYFTTNPLG